MAIVMKDTYDPDTYDVSGGNDSMETAVVIVIDQTPKSSISSLNLHVPGDEDYYQFELSSQAVVGDRVFITFENEDGDLDMSLLDADGKTITQSAGSNDLEGIVFDGLAAGTYYIKVSSPFDSINEYTLNWSFTTNNVAADELEGQEPYTITGSTDLANLSISAAADGVTQEDTFKLSLTRDGNVNSKIRFSNYRSDWSGLKYDLKDADGKDVLSGTGSEISLNGLAAGEYTLAVDAPIEGAYSTYDLSVDLPESARTKWTYMVYMAADSNLCCDAIYDIVGMQQADLDPEIEIYVLADRCPEGAEGFGDLVSFNGTYKWDSVWTDTRVGKITYSPGQTVTVDWESWGELDTGSIGTLERFVDWVQKQSVADNYAMILWDHGSEDATLCFDLTTDPDWGACISIKEVADLLKKNDANIPLVFFYDCLLGSELTATQMAGATEAIVVSEPPGYTQSTFAINYFFNTITADMTAQEMAQLMVRNVVASNDEDGTSFTMLSAVDVRGSGLADALEAFADAVAAAGNDADKTVLINAMVKASQDGCIYSGCDVLQSDLGDLIRQAMSDRNYENTSEGFKTALAGVKTALDAIILEFRSVPAGRGSGLAYFNTVATVMNCANIGGTPERADSTIKSHITSAYDSNPLWGGLLYDLGTTYIAQNSDKVFQSAVFDILYVKNLVAGETVAVSDLGCFSGWGEKINGINMVGDTFFQVAITGKDVSTGSFIVKSESGAPVEVSILSSGGAVIATGADSVFFENLSAGKYYIRLRSETDCHVTLSFDADWTTGVDRYDYARSKKNKPFVNGNGTIAKATVLDAGYYSGLLTYAGDKDYYRIGNTTTKQYKVVLAGDENWTVAEYDKKGNLIKNADFSEDVFTLTMDSMHYLLVEGDADMTESLLNSYSFKVTALENGFSDVITLDSLAGSKDEVSWKTSRIATQYTVEYSTDNFEHVIQFDTTGTAVDMLNLPSGTYQWRVAVSTDGEEDWIVGEEIVSDNTAIMPRVFQSKSDASDDMFFATPNGTWTGLYCAKHTGFKDVWEGTGETVSLSGKGRIRDLFFGSADPSTLYLTDSENGDALFLDDVFTGLPEEIKEEQTARLLRIQQIQGGAGDDIIDMTSDKFEFVGERIVISGGDGNDVIWANKRKNVLFGDAGDDRIVGGSGNDTIVGGIGNDSMHGGGGDDVFAFCDNWGIDTIEQLEGGSVTLWFASQDLAQSVQTDWNAETRIFTCTLDKNNSITVSGVAEDQIQCVFGDDGTRIYVFLDGMMAFDEYLTQGILTNG